MSNAQENQIKLNGVVDVRAFGAKGDGVTDDAAAFTAALAVSRHLVVPAGTYRLASTVTLPENTVLQGAGRRASIIKVDAAVVGMSRGARATRGHGPGPEGHQQQHPIPGCRNQAHEESPPRHPAPACTRAQ